MALRSISGVRKWKSIARRFSVNHRYLNIKGDAVAQDVPKGHCPVYVGSQRLRFVIPIDYLNNSLFKSLLDTAADEFGFGHKMGVVIPCEEADFQNYTTALENLLKMKRHSSFSTHL